MKFSRRLFTFVAAATATVASVVVAGPAAEAQEKNVVLLGDSLMANPTFVFAEYM